MGMTIAVDDIDNAAPIASAEGGLRPRLQAAAARMSVVTTTCAKPEPEHQMAHAP